MTSKYLGRVSKALKETGTLIMGEGLLVEKLPEAEIKSKGGIVIASATHGKFVSSMDMDRPLEVLVVALGEGHVGEDGEAIPLDSAEGNILIVSPHSVKWFSSLPIAGYEPNTLGIMNETATQIRFKSQEEYERFRLLTTA